MVFETASVSELYDFTRYAVKDAATVCLAGLAPNEISHIQGFDTQSELGAFDFSAALKTRGYRKNSRPRRIARKILGEKGWTDVFISYRDANDTGRNRHFLAAVKRDSVSVVIGDSRESDATVRDPKISDIATLNQAIAFMTYDNAEDEPND